MLQSALPGERREASVLAGVPRPRVLARGDRAGTDARPLPRRSQNGCDGLRAPDSRRGGTRCRKPSCSRSPRTTCSPGARRCVRATPAFRSGPTDGDLARGRVASGRPCARQRTRARRRHRAASRRAGRSSHRRHARRRGFDNGETRATRALRSPRSALDGPGRARAGPTAASQAGQPARRARRRDAVSVTGGDHGRRSRARRVRGCDPPRPRQHGGRSTTSSCCCGAPRATATRQGPGSGSGALGHGRRGAGSGTPGGGTDVVASTDLPDSGGGLVGLAARRSRSAALAVSARRSRARSRVLLGLRPATRRPAAVAAVLAAAVFVLRRARGGAARAGARTERRRRPDARRRSSSSSTSRARWRPSGRPRRPDAPGPGARRRRPAPRRRCRTCRAASPG